MLIAVGNKMINLDQVREIDLSPMGSDPQNRFITVTFSDGSVVHYDSPREIDPSVLANCVIPAPAGYVLLRYAPADGHLQEGIVFREPIIGFQVSRDYLLPVLLDGMLSDDDDTAILRPDGKVEVMFDRLLESEDDFRRYKDEKYPKRSVG